MIDFAHIRVLSFGVIFATVAWWERLAPRRPATVPRLQRWIANLGLTVMGSLPVQLLLPVILVSVATAARAQHWGLLNQNDWPPGFTILLGILVLDLAIYLQHVMFHAVPLLWRLHMVHHADLDYDLTTGLRFHPLEILLSLGIKAAVIGSFGVAPIAVLLFEIILNGMAMFNHGNIAMATSADRLLRLLLVTPDMHRVHHSVIIRETNSNFGFNLSCWDRLFGTYQPQPAAGHLQMTIGLARFRDPKRLNLSRLLVLPLVEGPGRQPINRH